MTAEIWSPPWSPDWCKHVSGKWTARVVDEDGLPEPQKVHVACSQCGAEYNTVCSTGSVKTHITRFAYVHIHKELKDIKYPIRDLALKPV